MRDLIDLISKGMMALALKLSLNSILFLETTVDVSMATPFFPKPQGNNWGYPGVTAAGADSRFNVPGPEEHPPMLHTGVPFFAESRVLSRRERV